MLDLEAFYYIAGTFAVLLAVALLILAFAKSVKKKPTEEPASTGVTNGASALNDRCAVCRTQQATERLPSIQASRGLGVLAGIMRRWLSIPPVYARVAPPFAPIIFCGSCIHLADAILDRAIASTRATQAQAIIDAAASHSMTMQDLIEQARACIGKGRPTVAPRPSDATVGQA